MFDDHPVSIYVAPGVTFHAGRPYPMRIISAVLPALVLALTLAGCSERTKDGTIQPMDNNNIFQSDAGIDTTPPNNNIPGNGSNNPPDDNMLPPVDEEDAGVQPTGPLCTDISDGVSIWGVSKVCGYGTDNCLVGCLNSYANHRDVVQYNNCYDLCLVNDDGYPKAVPGGEIDCANCIIYQQLKCLADYGCESQVDTYACCATSGAGSACTNENSALDTCTQNLGQAAAPCYDYGSVAYAVCFNNDDE